MRTFYYNIIAFTSFFAIATTDTLAQENNYIDSLSHLLETAERDTHKVHLLNTLSKYYYHHNLDQSFIYAKEALALSKSLSYERGIIESMCNRIEALRVGAQYDQAIALAKEALQLAEETEDHYNIALTLTAICIVNGVRGNYEPALKYGQKALEESQKTQNPDLIANTKKILGSVHRNIGNYDKATAFSLDALNAYEASGNKKEISQLLNNLAIIYSVQKRHEKALEYCKRSIDVGEGIVGKRDLGHSYFNMGAIYNDMKENPKALYYYSRALRLYEDAGDKKGKASLENNIGMVHSSENKPAEALAFFLRAVASYEALRDSSRLANAMNNVSRSYRKLGRYNEALQYARKGLAVAKKSGRKEILIKVYANLSRIHAKMKHCEQSLSYLLRYTAIKDSIHNATRDQRITDMQVKYETAEKEKEIARLNEEQARKDARIAKQKQRQNTIIFSLLGFFTIVFAFYSRYKNRKQLQLEKQGMEYEQKALHLQMNPHFIFNSLGSINSFVTQNEIKPAVAFLSKFARLMRLTLEHSQESAVPIEKEMDTLRYYMELEQLRFNNCFDFDITIDENVPSDLPIPSLLIQPFVENAILHGLAPKKKGGKLEVRFFIETDQLICSIKDNGIGREEAMERKKAGGSKHRSLAMHIVEERLNILNKTAKKNLGFSINDLKDSDSNSKGTEVRIYLGTYTEVVAA